MVVRQGGLGNSRAESLDNLQLFEACIWVARFFGEACYQTKGASEDSIGASVWPNSV